MLALVAGYGVLLGSFRLVNFDVWWHLRTGQWILSHGVVPLTDIYTYTSADRTWIDVHWGFQAAAAWLHGLVGIRGLVLAKAVLAGAVAAVAFVAGGGMRKPAVAVLAWLPFLLLMSGRFYVRPEIVTLLFSAVFLAILFDCERHPRRLWWLPVLQVCWANVQGLFVFGPLMVACFFAEACLRTGRTRGVLRHLIPVGLLCGVACAVSPYRWWNVVFVYELFQKVQSSDKAIYQQTIAELQSLPDFLAAGGWHSPSLWLIGLTLTLLAVGFLGNAKRLWRERRLAPLLLAAGFVWLLWGANRNSNHFALVAGVVTARNLTQCAGRLRPRWAVLGLTAASLLVGSGWWFHILGNGREVGYGLPAGRYAFDAAAAAGADGMPPRAACLHMGQAACFLYLNGPERKVFFDARLEVNSAEMFRTFTELGDSLNAGDDRWRQILRRHDTDLLLVDAEFDFGAQATLLAAGWRCVHFDDTAAVFLAPSLAGPPAFRFADALDSAPVFAGPLPTATAGYRMLPPGPAGPHQRFAKRVGATVAAWASRPGADPHEVEKAALLVGRHALLALADEPAATGRLRLLATPLTVLAGSGPAAGRWRAGVDLPWTMAIHLHRHLVRSDPDDYVSVAALAGMLETVGAADEAVALYERLLTLPTDNATKVTFRDEIRRRLDGLRGANRQELPPIEAGAAIVWHLRRGRADQAADIVETDYWRGVIATVAGDYPTARRLWNRDAAVERRFLALLTGVAP